MLARSSSPMPARPVTPRLTTAASTSNSTIANPAAAARAALKSRSSSSSHNVAASSPSTSTTTAAANAGSAAMPAPHDRSRSDALDFSTLSRTPTPSNGTRTPPSASPQNSQDSEVAALTTKLINSVNHGTDLEDSLAGARGELESARQELRRLHDVAEDERTKRVEAERAKRRLESEVDDLTQQLFVEAQNMVTSARRQNEETEQRNEQLKAQLKDAETLLASHQDQLRELKDMLQQVQLERSASESSVNPSGPSTPLTGPTGKAGGVPDLPSNRPHSNHVTVDHPLSFSTLIAPVLRTDLQSHEDFVGMLEAGRKAQPASRANSGNFAGLNVMGIGSLSNFRQSSITKPSSMTTPQTSSNSSLATSSPAHPHIPGAFHSGSPAEAQNSPTIASSLKDQKFYKRAVQEDIDPTLRLETAPGLSFFSKRNVVSSMASGTLFVEPFGPSSRFWNSTLSCALCGEERNEEPYLRKHRFRTSDSDDAQRYMVCDYCLGRLQATGDFVNFLRMVRSGLWKSESADDVRLAWEECTRLRERMFWARVGGGVVPVQSLDAVLGSPRKVQRASSDGDQPRSSSSKEGEPQEGEYESVPAAFVPKDITRIEAGETGSPVARRFDALGLPSGDVTVPDDAADESRDAADVSSRPSTATITEINLEGATSASRPQTPAG